MSTVLINIIGRDMGVAEALYALTIHHPWLPDKLFLEPGFSPYTITILQNMGQQFSTNKTMGSV